MSVELRPDDSKAIYGALFIQFIIYAAFYIFSHIRDIQIKQLNNKRLYGKLKLYYMHTYFNLIENLEKEKEQHQHNKDQQQEDVLQQRRQKKSKQQNSEGNQEDQKKQEENDASLLGGGCPRPQIDLRNDPAEYRARIDRNYAYSFSLEILYRYPSEFHYVAAGSILCGALSPSTFAVALAYMSLMFRALYMLAGYIKNPCMTDFFFVGNVSCVVALYATACFYNKDS